MTYRTTVTLDSDVAEQLKDVARRRNMSFKEVLNNAVRRGLEPERGEGPRPFKVEPHAMNLRQGIDLTHALALADSLEDEEIIRKMELRK